MTPLSRRTFLRGRSARALTFACGPYGWSADNDLGPIRAEVKKRHDESVRRPQQWVHQESIAAKNRSVVEGIELGMQSLRDAGSWPGYVSTGSPLNLPAGHFELGHGTGAHAPDDYYVIDSTNPEIDTSTELHFLSSSTCLQ